MNPSQFASPTFLENPGNESTNLNPFINYNSENQNFPTIHNLYNNPMFFSNQQQNNISSYFPNFPHKTEHEMTTSMVSDQDDSKNEEKIIDLSQLKFDPKTHPKDMLVFFEKVHPGPLLEHLPIIQSISQSNPHNGFQFKEEDARDFIHEVQERFKNKPENYRLFIHLLHQQILRQSENSNLYPQINKLFNDHPDLIEKFNMFVPKESQFEKEKISLTYAFTLLYKIKHKLHDKPDVYNKFVTLLREQQTKALPHQVVMSRVKKLFHNFPELSKEFEVFLQSQEGHLKQMENQIENEFNEEHLNEIENEFNEEHLNQLENQLENEFNEEHLNQLENQLENQFQFQFQFQFQNGLFSFENHPRIIPNYKTKTSTTTLS
ncbi:sin3a isoform g [Anaeramoeba ignava]|uniref:Sin3a isoform g n=1 Tax=Anaeramoeba ignava TaxID=1746090 RepID=A0A9Q0LR73_ANAIG|nr:sin3a isoform g [Anaeramoeba ignava]